MTREVATKRLREILTEAVEFENSVCYVTEEDREPLEMAIQALSQEPCTDAQERYEDLCEYFGDAKDILKSRKDFKAWLERIKWHIRKAEELYEKYEYKQEPCDDAINRKKVEEMIKAEMPERGAWEIGGNLGDIEKQTVCEVCVDLLQSLNELPSVTQKSKTGHWILADEQNKEDVENGNYRFICSECQCSDIHAKSIIVPYCWKCGAKMESER